MSNWNFIYNFCSCRPKLPFFGAQAKAHHIKFEKDKRHRSLRKYYLCSCQEGAYFLPPLPSSEEKEHFNQQHKHCDARRKQKIGEEKKSGTYSLRVHRDKLRRLFGELETAQYLFDRQKEMEKRLVSAEAERREKKQEEEEEENEKRKEDEVLHAIASISEREMGYDNMTEDLFDGLTVKDSEVSREMKIVLEDGDEQIWRELLETDVVSESTNVVVAEKIRGIRQSPSHDMAISDLKDQLARERRWKEILQEKVKELEGNLEGCMTRESCLIKKEEELNQLAGVVKSAEKVLLEQTATIERREKAVKVIDERVAEEKRDLWQREEEFEKQKRQDAKLKEEEKLKQQMAQKIVKERVEGVPMKRRRALIHIPIEEGIIAGKPHLVRNLDETRTLQCFGPPVTTCGHLQIVYEGEFRSVQWWNVKTESLMLKRRCENDSSDDDDLNEKRIR